MISILKQIEQSENSLLRFRALRRAYLALAGALPMVALPVNPELSGQCKEECDKFTALLDDTSPAQTIDQAGKVVLDQLEAIYHSNRAGIEERDAALKDVVASVAEAISSFKGHGERHETSLSRLADEFDSLSRVDNVSEIRRRLQDQVCKLRETAQEMRRENDKAVQQFASQLPGYQQRLEMARKQSGVDRLTGLGSRREAERRLRYLSKQEGAVTVLLFDIEGFKAINSRYGALFGDKLLRALAHLLHSCFPEDDTLFRWGADEFLVIVEGSPPSWLAQCGDICQSFATGGKYYTAVDDGSKVALAAAVAFGAVQYIKGESMEDLCHRTQMVLDQNRKSLSR
ncbi:MAG: diguanylate cyclase [Candidatus Solibacter sp.]|jgi:diguanylate cyclase (GGDEF)-like protein